MITRPILSTPLSMSVLASDMGVPLLTSTLMLTVSVYDVNDNSPVFDQLSYEVIILESEPVNSRFFKVEATDKDSGLNGEVMYDIVDGNTANVFGIFPDGQLYIKAELDREVQDRYDLVLVATDRAVQPLSTSVNVSVILDDVNDNRPLFNSTNYVFHFEEEQKRGSLVGRVFAVDKDFGPNSEVRYAFETQQPNFELNAITGELTSTLQLDRESLMRQRGAAVFSFTVVSSDQGLPKPLRDQAKVQVYIQDINDNPPKFTKDIYQASISESAQNMTQLLRVSAVDVDESKNGLVHYYIKEGNEESQFTIDGSSGQVTLVGRLDYEATSSYSLKMIAVDSGTMPLSSSCMLMEITVLDVNDNHPVFDREPFHADILENLSPQRVLMVSAMDQDSGPNGQLEYAIIDGNKENSFSVNRATGEIRTTRPLDREKLAQYALKVKATDRGNSPKSTAVKVLINVLDVNDNAPRFSKIFSATVPENAPVGYTVTRVTTTDEDAGANAISKYSITDASLPFTINPSTGDITISRPLNREDTDHYIAKVSAHDSGWTVSTDVTIFVTDVNDNAPRFSRPSYYLDYPELTEVGSLVTQVSATDPDEGVNGNIFYFIRSQSEYFRINSSSGEIFIKQHLKYQNSTGSNINLNRHSFIITASDRATKPLMSETTVIVNIVDSNDNPPMFESSSYFTPVTKSVKVGTKLIRVIALDNKDFGLNSEVDYIISGGNSTSKFKLDKQSGWVAVASSLTSDMNKVFLMDVTARDKGNPPLSARTTVKVAVTEENHHTPEFSQSHVTATIPESLAVGTAIRTLSARDKDKEMNGSFASEIQ
uniref:FAT atypical cadherin 4 n=1 Tax=Hucho hucho TaxID=62062 RepID=A0A4W5QMW1_9TELE